MGGSTFVFIELLSLLLRKEVRFSYYVFMKEEGIPYVLSVWVRRVLREFCFTLRS